MFRIRQFFAATIAAAAVGCASPALAGLEGCNKTTEEIYVAIAHNSDQGWLSLGWWTIQPKSCVTMLGGDLQNRYYYAYAESASGRTWGGEYEFCIQDPKFDIVGGDDCESRGYETAGFHEHDVGGNTEFTILIGP